MGQRTGPAPPGTKEVYMDAGQAKPCVDLLLNVIEGASQPFVVADTNGRIVGCNAAFCRLLGYDREQLVGAKSIPDLTPPEWRKNESGIIAGQVRSKMPAIYRKEYLRRDGSRLPIEVYNHTIFDRAGRPLYFYAFVSELSERKVHKG
jgi:PAS domain S-box-containing protein